MKYKAEDLVRKFREMTSKMYDEGSIDCAYVLVVADPGERSYSLCNLADSDGLDHLLRTATSEFSDVAEDDDDPPITSKGGDS